MQYPQYSFTVPQSSGRVPGEGHSVFRKNTADESQLNNLSKSQGTANLSQQSQSVYRPDVLQGETSNISDQPSTTWHWRSQGQHSQPALPTQEAPRAEHVPANSQSFAPPVDLGQLQRVDRPQRQDQFASDIYKSPIDRPYVGKSRQTIVQLDASAETSSNLDDAASYFKEQSSHASAMPQRDQVTEAKEFISPYASDETLLVAPTPPKATTDSGGQVIVLRSQSPQKLAEARAKEATAKRPDAQLLTPDFESYVGSPVLDTTRDAYQDATQWKIYSPKTELVNPPPSVVFESLPKAAAPTPVVEFSPSSPPPAPTNHAFEASEEVAALPEPPPIPAPETKENLFQPTSVPVSTHHVFSAASNRSVNPVSVPKVESAQPSYRFGGYETGGDVETNTTAMTVAHTTPVAPPVATDSAWLSPWWMLVCLVPLAMYFVKGRRSEVDDYSYAYDEVGDRPRLPPEMIERPGYSKSDALYGEKDDYFATEQLFSQAQRDLVAERIPMATHLRAAGKSCDDLEGILPAETVTADTAPEIRFAGSNSVQTDIELDGDDSPNFRSQSDDEPGEFEIPEWLS